VTKRTVGANFFKHGSWNFICDVCGQKYKSEESRKRWDGLVVCKKDWEPRHPQELIRVPAETGQAVPDPRPDVDFGADIFVSIPYVILYWDGGYVTSEGGSSYMYEGL
jgi:hypothetical protein